MLNLGKLNNAQRKAVTHPGGPAIVLAGPGSGKTFLIINRIIYLIENQKISPETILVITFTRAAALSMQRRFEEGTGGKFTGVRFCTFHSFFYQILIEYDSYNNNSLFKMEDKILYLKRAFEQLGFTWDNSADYEAFLSNPSLAVPEGLTEEQAQLVYRKFEEQIRIERKLDFDDMADVVIRLFQNKPRLLKQIKESCKHIIVDEYQDTNREQEEILALLSAPENEIMVVGDDDQSIYGFRGSRPAVMKNFRIRYPNAKLYFLDVNYRSTGEIVNAATAVIRENEERFIKALKAEKENGEPVKCLGLENKTVEYRYIGERIWELKEEYGFSFSEMAIITRTNRELEALALFLQKRGIPCLKKEKGKNISEHFVAKEIIGCMEFVTGKRDRAPDIWVKMGGDERKRKLLLKQLPVSAIHFIYNVMGYKTILKKQAASLEEREGVEAKVWLEDWETIFSVIKNHAGQYKCMTKWVEELPSFLETKAQVKNEEGIQLLTMHGSKGLEFSYVCIPDVNEGIIPGKRSRKKEDIEEERRLFYVAMTRAKKVLDILYLTGTPEYPRLPSRFLKPLLKNVNHSSE